MADFEPSHTYSFFTEKRQISPKADIVHYPFFDPFFLTLPWTSPKPTVVSVHDLIPIVYPEHFPAGFRGQLKWQAQKFALRRVATTILTDSRASKKDIEQLLGFAPEHVFAVPLAPRKVFHPIKDKKRLTKVRKDLNLNNKFILYVGDVNWNKNIPGIVHAFNSYVKKSDNALELVLVGMAFRDTDIEETKAIHQEVDRLGLTSSIKMPGFVSDEDLAGLYSQAEALVYPSFAEGFGFPILEAMACGCPVVTSNVSGLLEIAGPAVTVDPNKAEDILRGLDMVLSFSSEIRREAIRNGFEWVKQFTWEKVAHETVAVYEKTFHHHSGV